ncbi:hypothetical protein [Pseudobacter ginsenosidimutans]|uniref:DUF4397 domain-containing protein n=1 Tax=Pseudobacter ginsenosidimutans TaxID=661488 RepID=A0A4Q7N537_9BACT|nr:hypothetical protein [Pseudobacter ginsenosidimutans]QEC44648.1 DUF4397 domain-containing protein [Pseudobacter ginsenosidimutans]RZS76129.1 hypothetical protein EV199_2007 [Pseudobacter ginsenosidimutans]
MPIFYTGITRTIYFRNRVLSAIPVFLLLTFFSACKKTKLYDVNPATIQPVNLLDDGVVLRANLSGKHPIRYGSALAMFNKSFDQRNIFVNSFPQRMDLYAQPDTMPHDRPVISVDLQLETGKIYSMFIYGEKATATFSILEDQYPAYRENDSLTFIRFANFSEGQPVSVNIKGMAPGSLIQSLPFKSVTDFALFKAAPGVADHEFEIREQASGNLITSFATVNIGNINLPLWLGRPFTLILTGRASGTGTNQQKIVVMKHR